jgi:hypothetical protein
MGDVMRRVILRAVLLLLPAVVSSYVSGFAQEAEPQDESPGSAIPHRGAQYFLGEADELLMRVNIWGFVRKPGQYMVPTDTDLISLMSFAGGPVEQAKIKSIRIVRTNPANVKTTSVEGGASGGVNQSMPAMAAEGSKGKADARAQRVLQINVKEYLTTGKPELIPPLMPGDTVIVEGSTLNTVNKVLDFASKIAVIGQVYFWISVAQRD